MAHRVRNVKMRNRAKFRAIGQSMIEISRFSNFNIAAVRHLGFLVKILTVDRVMMVNMRHRMQNFVAIGETVVEIWRYFDFSR